MNKKVQSLSLKNFAAFEAVMFDFCPGLNVLIGTNSTGKTLTIKMIYSLLKAHQNYCRRDQLPHEQGIDKIFRFHKVFQIEDLAEYQTNTNIDMRFFALYKSDRITGVNVESGQTLADIEHNPILEEFAAHYDRESALFENSEHEKVDGSNWEMLCIYCHDNEHSRALDAEWLPTQDPPTEKKPTSTYSPFADLKSLLRLPRHHEEEDGAE